VTFSTETIELGQALRFNLDVILREDLQCMGTVSLACCYDVIEHHNRDIERLYAVHQKLVHPSKHIAYAAFWIRKLKPVDSTYPIAEIERAIRTKTPINQSLEVRDINERICLYYTFSLLNEYVNDNHIELPSGVSKEDFLVNIGRVFRKFVSGGDIGPGLTDRYEAIVYDMRYRTFGPHHVVHLVSYLLTEASHYGNS
jgi:hypothetical protein